MKSSTSSVNPICEMNRCFSQPKHEMSDNSPHPDYLGNTGFITDITGRPYQHFYYAPFGEVLVEQHAMNGNYDSPYRFNAKEVDPETGYYYYGARYYDPKTSIWLSVDPLSDLSPNMTPYHFVANNPVRNIDPDGRDWYEVTNEETGKTEIKWTDYSNQDQMNKNGVTGTYLGKAVVVMDGRGGENLDENGKLTGDGANPAKTTIYGPGGQDDVRTYDGLTISSNPEYFTPIEQGDYEGFYQQMASSSFGKGSLTYRIKQLNGDFRIPTADGELNKDPASENYGTPWKTDIFFHRTNNSGFAGTRSRQVAVSKGCPVICATQWRNVESQLGKINSFRLRIIR